MNHVVLAGKCELKEWKDLQKGYLASLQIEAKGKNQKFPAKLFISISSETPGFEVIQNTPQGGTIYLKVVGSVSNRKGNDGVYRTSVWVDSVEAWNGHSDSQSPDQGQGRQGPGQKQQGPPGARQGQSQQQGGGRQGPSGSSGPPGARQSAAAGPPPPPPGGSVEGVTLTDEDGIEYIIEHDVWNEASKANKTQTVKTTDGVYLSVCPAAVQTTKTFHVHANNVWVLKSLAHFDDGIPF